MAVRYVQRRLNEGGRDIQEVEPPPAVYFQVSEYLYSLQREILIKSGYTHSRTKLYLKPVRGRKFRSKREVLSFVIAGKRLRNKGEMKDNSVMLQPSNSSGSSDKKDLLGSKTPGVDLNKKDPLGNRTRGLLRRRTGCSFSVGDPSNLMHHIPQFFSVVRVNEASKYLNLIRLGIQTP